MARVMLIHCAIEGKSACNMQRALESRGHEVRVADVDAGCFPNSECDVVIVDMGTSGLNIVRVLRQHDTRVGIVLLVGDEGVARVRIDGLAIGADLCESVPINIDLLSAYVDAIARRVSPGEWRLDMAARILRAPRQHEIKVNDKEITLLKLLAGSASHVADRVAIAHAFGIDWLAFDERALEKAVSRLRQKWRKNAMSDLPLKTVHGVGYCFTERIQLC